MSRIGILGGTFNPIHSGHIKLGNYAQKELSLDKVFLIPTYTPPHKSSEHLISESHRLNMCKIASEKYSFYEVNDIEIKLRGKSYTYKTLELLNKQYPDDELFLIMGADMFLTLDRWKNPDIIFEYASIIAAPRNESNFSQMKMFYDKVLRKFGAECHILQNPVEQVSSTFIRKNIKNSDLVSHLLDADVYKYIIANNLYCGSDSNDN